MLEARVAKNGRIFHRHDNHPKWHWATDRHRDGVGHDSEVVWISETHPEKWYLDSLAGSGIQQQNRYADRCNPHRKYCGKVAAFRVKRAGEINRPLCAVHAKHYIKRNKGQEFANKITGTDKRLPYTINPITPYKHL